MSGPVLAGDRLIVAGSNGALINVNPTDGSFQSQVDVKDGVSFQPVVAEQHALHADGQRPADRLPLEVDPHRRRAGRGSAMPLPTVAIVGRPNVGKSTLFNRLVGKRVALVDDRPGVTRDRREGEGQLLGLEFRVMDTAGFEDEDPQSLPGRMRAQTEAAVREADVALFLIDAREGLTPLDEEIAPLAAQRIDTPVIVAANKAEGRAGEAGRLEAYALGLGEPFALVGRAWRGPGRPVRGDPPARRARGCLTEDEEDEDEEAGRSSSPSSAGPMPASRPWSTRCSARSG